MEQRISLVTLGVADLGRARRFYEALGWVSGAQPADDVVFFQAGGMIVALWGRDQLAEDSGVDDPGGWGGVTLAYFQYALHQLPDPVGALRSAAGALRDGGWLIALDWYLPTDPEELLTRHGELLAGMQLDELVSGTRLVTSSEALGWFADAGLATPGVIDLPSGATPIVARR